ncbi:LacI family DNA-binding transcriptional regulator [Streptomyces vilmorinianum]|uniref:LacI family DNA-binding transcriptional regulator n=1 Tax=Streptomyces vilmorinianum TaxID=3051092 RepID=UPI0010FB3825|nr:LacI family DNA-binding transcriptional regulator [Streptomyces vilmorinianum]
MATIVDVARLAGVSTSTVSHVINATRPVNPRTRERVEDAIRATGYQRDSVARALRRSRTDSIGLIVSDVAQPAFAEMVRGVEHEATKAGYTLLLANSGEDPALERRALRVLAERKVDGLVVAPVGRSERAGLEAVRAQGIPLVVMDRLGALPTDQVGVENADPMGELVRHLVGHGHRRIALAAGDRAVATIEERCRGYREALAASGIGYEDELVLWGSGLAADTRARVHELFAGPQPPSALVAVSTETAIGSLQALRARELDIPGDVAFAAFDGFPYMDLFRPGITAVTQPAYEIGSTAMSLLLSRMDGTLTSRHRSIRLQPELTYRESCGCPA